VSLRAGHEREILTELTWAVHASRKDTFDGDGKPLTNGKKEPFEELVRKCAGTPEFFLSSIFSSQKRTGNFLSLDRSERKELFIRELLGLDRLRLIAAAAKEKAEKVAQTVIGLEGQLKSLRESVGAATEDPAEVEAQLADVTSRLDRAEAERRIVDSRMAELQAIDSNRRLLLAEKENLKQRLRRSDAKIAETKRPAAKDESLLAGKKDLPGLTEREAALAVRIEDLHRQIQEVQGLETTNREVERIVDALDAELRTTTAELDRLRVEREELAVVPCRGEGVYVSCPKILRAVEAGKKIPTLEGEVATLSLEVEVQRGSLVQIATPSTELTRTLEGCERDRRNVEQERRRHEELRAVEARREERVKGLERLNQARAELAAELARKESALAEFSDLDARMQSSRREAEKLGNLISAGRRERDNLIARQAQIKQRQEQLEAARTRLAQVETEHGLAKTEVEDYSYLAKVFGPDEIQLCEIQAAGPEVSSLVNALLEGCFDNKFEIRFRTQRPKADGGGMVNSLAGSSFWSTKRSTSGSPYTTCGGAKMFITKRCSETKRLARWIPATPRNMCECYVGPWTWADFTKSSSFATRRLFGSWRTGSWWSATGRLFRQARKLLLPDDERLWALLTSTLSRTTVPQQRACGTGPGANAILALRCS